VRRPDGVIHTEAHPLVDRWARLRQTFLRGPLALVDAVSIGMRANAIAVRISTGTESSGGIGIVLAPVAVAIIGVFVVLPGLLSVRWEGATGDVVEASLRAAVLLVYLLLIGRSTFARRLFAYHGAEHMVIAAYERHLAMPTLERAERESPVHVRCGTDFIALFVIACGVLFSIVPREPMWFAGVVRVALLPVVMALAYEVMRAAARYEGSLGSRVVTWPGRALQRITTRRPSGDMLEVALVALRTAVSDVGAES
jgi:uncharacterized protein YqhQ